MTNPNNEVTITNADDSVEDTAEKFDPTERYSEGGLLEEAATDAHVAIENRPPMPRSNSDRIREQVDILFTMLGEEQSKATKTLTQATTNEDREIALRQIGIINRKMAMVFETFLAR